MSNIRPKLSTRVSHALIATALIAALTIILQGCSGSTQRHEAVRNMSPDQQPNETPVAHYARTMDRARLQKLREGIRRINFGDREEPVTALVGPPDEVDVTAPKRSRSSQDEVRILVYDVNLVGATRGNVRDQTVMLWFDHAGQLTAINSNVDGIESRHR